MTCTLVTKYTVSTEHLSRFLGAAWNEANRHVGECVLMVKIVNKMACPWSTKRTKCEVLLALLWLSWESDNCHRTCVCRLCTDNGALAQKPSPCSMIIRHGYVWGYTKPHSGNICGPVTGSSSLSCKRWHWKLLPDIDTLKRIAVAPGDILLVKTSWDLTRPLACGSLACETQVCLTVVL